VSDYAAMEFIQSHLPPDAKVYMLWDARSYHCDSRCFPDWQKKQWVELTSSNSSPTAVASKLREMNVSHLLLSSEDVDYAVMHDPTGLHLQALQFLLDDFKPACAREIYQDEWTMLYELTCR
jgi:hypothetical protein